MATIQHNKLVRDKIPEIITSNGAVAETKILDNDNEYLTALCEKLTEEALEVSETPIIDELADTLEVIHSIGNAIGVSPQDIESARAAKAEKRGGFEHRVYLISTTED